MKILRFKSLLLAMACSMGLTHASVVLPEIIGDNMVLQQQTDVKLWGWAAPGTKVTVKPSWSKTEYTATTASDGRWDVSVPTPAASFDPQSITISDADGKVEINNVLIGEVWLASGQSNMEMPLRGFGIQGIEGAAQAIAYSGKYPGIRMVTIPKMEAKTPQDKAPGKWKTSNPANAPEFSALAYFFAQSLTDILNVPVGIITCAYGGSKAESWLPREIVATYPEFDVDGDINGTSGVDDWHRAVVRYNAMLYPIAGYTIKGVIWNQGESNVGMHDSYPQHMTDLAKHWTELWGQGEDLPFYQVEIPGWNYDNPEGTDAALLREAQHKAAKMMPKGGIVSTSDLIYPYELEDIHASQKKPIGERLAFLAAAKDYGMPTIAHRYPELTSYNIDGNKAILKFGNLYDGLTPNDELEGFEVAGEDRVFYPAKATENWNNYEITVTAPAEVPEIKSVRYCFKNFAIGKVHSMMGLPVIPFRTDDWDK